MKVITDFLAGIGEAVVSAFEFLVDTVEGLAYIVKLTGYFLERIPDYFAWMPSEYITLVVLVFGIAVVYKILGREG